MITIIAGGRENDDMDVCRRATPECGFTITLRGPMTGHLPTATIAHIRT